MGMKVINPTAYIDLGFHIRKHTETCLKLVNPINHSASVFLKKGGERKYCNMSCSNIRRGSLGHLTDNINRAGPHTGDTRCNQHFAQSTQDYNNQRPYMEITRSPLPQNNSNLPLPFFCCNYPIFLLDNIY